MVGLRVIGVSLLLPLLIGQEQAPVPPPIHFDAISIKENRGDAEQGGMEISPSSDRIFVTNAKMFRIIAFAYNRSRNDLIEGLPDWTRDERWDVQAKVADEDLSSFQNLTFEQKKLLLQVVLKERCNLRAHMAKKKVPVYALVVAKSGLRLHEASVPGKKAPAAVWNIQVKRGEIEGHAVPMAALLYSLSGISLDRQVVDKTGLTALYDFDLKWTPDDAPRDTENGQATAQAPSLFTAIQEQLGLRLQPIQDEVEAIVVEHIDRPSPN